VSQRSKPTLSGKETEVLHGSCLCGHLKYKISGELSGALNRHYTLCRIDSSIIPAIHTSQTTIHRL
jgi:hypothetical protein